MGYLCCACIRYSIAAEIEGHEHRVRVQTSDNVRCRVVPQLAVKKTEVPKSSAQSQQVAYLTRCRGIYLVAVS